MFCSALFWVSRLCAAQGVLLSPGTHRGSLRHCYVIFAIVMLFCVRGTLASEGILYDESSSRLTLERAWT